MFCWNGALLMSKKTLFGVDYADKEWIKIILYLFVGGTAALVEWAFFYGFNQGMGMEYMLRRLQRSVWQRCIIISWVIFWFLPAVPDMKRVKNCL